MNYGTAINAHLTSNSWGGGGYSALLEQAISDANDAGILFVAAAGNDSSNNDTFTQYPASYPLDNIISVASTTDQDGLSSFSNFGLQTVDRWQPWWRRDSRPQMGRHR